MLLERRLGALPSPVPAAEPLIRLCALMAPMPESPKAWKVSRFW